MDKEIFKYLLLTVITISIATVLSMVLRKMLSLFIRKYSSKLKADPTNFLFIKNSVSFLIFTAAVIFIFYKIPYLKSVGTALFASAGILAVIIGMASQKAFSNIFSGIFILIFKPFKISDIVEVKGAQKGVVEEITLRHTVIKDFENRRIIIPNSIIGEDTIINSSIQDEKINKHILFHISYDSNIDKAINIIREAAEKHPNIIDNRTDEEKQKNEPVVIVRVTALSEYSVELKAYVWAGNNAEAFALMCDLHKSVKERFEKEGVEIPYPYRTIVYKKDQNDVRKNA